MFTTAILTVITSIWSLIFSKILPTNLPFVSLADYENYFSVVHDYIRPILSFVNHFFPLYLLFGLLAAWIMVHIIIFTFQSWRFIMSFVPTKPGAK